jgi:hypothetical protein
MSKALISTVRYANSHSKQPRGHGYWMFETKAREVVLRTACMYSEAKKEAEELGHLYTTLYVCS